MKFCIVVVFCVATIMGCLAAPKPEADPELIVDTDGVIRSDYLLHPHLRHPYMNLDPYVVNPYYRHYPLHVVPRVHPFVNPYFDHTLGRFAYPGLEFTKDKIEKLEEKLMEIEKKKE